MLCSKSATSLSGELYVPGDKSISHRALIFSALAYGESRIDNFLASDDCLATANALRAVGINIEKSSKQIIVEGRGMDGLSAPPQPLNLSNSGTSIRLLSGLFSAQKFSSQLLGDYSLNSRPMSRIQKPLQMMGANIQLSKQNTAPIFISPVSGLTGIDYVMPVASAQVKSCLLLAGLYAKGATTITEPDTSRDHSERMLNTFSYPLHSEANKVTIKGGGSLAPVDITVPCDISSAMFFIVATCITQNSEVIFRDVGINPTRIGALDILKRMNADITIDNIRNMNNEPVADISVRSSVLRGVEITPLEVALAIDEFPILFIAAACAEGETTLSGAKELRVKESDRIATMAEGLERCGIAIKTFEDGVVIKGSKLRGSKINAYNDHRVAMAFAIAGAVTEEPMLIENCATIGTSFPDFCLHARKIRLQITENN